MRKGYVQKGLLQGYCRQGLRLGGRVLLKTVKDFTGFLNVESRVTIPNLEYTLNPEYKSSFWRLWSLEEYYTN